MRMCVTRHRAARWATVSVMLAVLVVTASAGAAANVTRPRLAANASGSDRIALGTLDVNSSARTVCSARLNRGGRVGRLGTLRTGPGGGGQWRWTIARGAPGGRWTAHVTCGTRHRAGSQITFSVPQPVERAAGTIRLVKPATARGHATNTYASKRGGNGAAGGNPYPQGQCTWWVWSRRPDLPWFSGDSGNAKNWISSAQARGIPTGTAPVAGAVAVFQPGQYGAGGYGHVAYVESVQGSNIVISEANAGGPPGSRRTIGSSGLRFIYGGQAGNGPGAAAPAPPPPPPPVPVGTFAHHVYHTCANGECGLRAHSIPSVSAPVTAIRNDGDVVGIVCQITGDRVSGKDGSSSSVWDKLADGSYASDLYIDTSGTNGAFSPPIPRCAQASVPQPASPAPVPQPSPPSPVPVTHYNCGSTTNTLGHYVPAGKHWANDFVAQGNVISGGFLQLVANTDGQDHRAAIGIYTGGPDTLGAVLGQVTVPVSGNGGMSFTFPQPIHVTPGQRLWVAAVGIGDFTASDEDNGGTDGCFIGHVDGTR
ncbi:MAG: peptidoglycan DL-endopeptidase CwlO [Solirubrobacteraceae bacterium]|nr:peptidoglycan DL-endopeptidase CwlO [Solirubrobacteraceae bacterium]